LTEDVEDEQSSVLVYRGKQASPRHKGNLADPISSRQSLAQTKVQFAGIAV
jgi:hypothetical protein